MRKPRYSPQRDTILNIIKRHKGHLSVDKIYDRARKKMPKISLGTVYRNLKNLEDMQLVSQTQGADQISYFETYAEPHHHFICTNCHKIENIDAPNVKVCTGCITGKIPFEVENIVTTLYGLCGNCK